MKKALQISLAKTLFTIEEDAYQRLENYLSSIRAHFHDMPGSVEIITDIEGRIAEQLLERRINIVTIEEIEHILASMGRVEDFDDGTQRDRSAAHTDSSSTGKKLYRNPDDAVIAGVCSGIAAYMGWNALWVRLAFILLSIFNGLDIMLYIILWIIMPKAKTAAQKLEMAGTPVTIETLSETVRERIDEIRTDRKDSFARLASLPAHLIEHLGLLFTRLGPAVRAIIGLALILGAGGVLVGLSIAGGFLFSGSLMLSDGMPLSTIFPGNQYPLMLSAALLTGFIPAFSALIGGVSIIRRKNIFPAVVWSLVMTLWFISIGISGFALSKIVTFTEGHAYLIEESRTATTTVQAE